MAKTIVVVLPDTGERLQSCYAKYQRFYNFITLLFLSNSFFIFVSISFAKIKN